MAVVALFVFSLLYIAPGDPAAVIAGDQATPADVERIRQSLGLDRPFLIRFGEWVWQILHGDLGTSIFTNLPVTTMIAQRIEPTLSLMAVTLTARGVVAVPIGVLAAWKAGTFIDRAIMAFAVFGFSVPVFVIGYLLAYVFALAARMAAGAGLYAVLGRPVAVAREPDPAGHRARLRLHRADRPHHPRRDARGAAARTTSAPRAPRASARAASCSCTRCRTPRCRSSR